MPKQTQRCCHASTGNSDFFLKAHFLLLQTANSGTVETAVVTVQTVQKQKHTKRGILPLVPQQQRRLWVPFQPRVWGLGRDSLQYLWLPFTVHTLGHIVFLNWLSWPGAFYVRSKVSLHATSLIWGCWRWDVAIIACSECTNCKVRFSIYFCKHLFLGNNYKGNLKRIREERLWF